MLELQKARSKAWGAAAPQGLLFPTLCPDASETAVPLTHPSPKGRGSRLARRDQEEREMTAARLALGRGFEQEKTEKTEV